MISLLQWLQGAIPALPPCQGSKLGAQNRISECLELIFFFNSLEFLFWCSICSAGDCAVSCLCPGNLWDEGNVLPTAALGFCRAPGGFVPNFCLSWATMSLGGGRGVNRLHKSIPQTIPQRLSPSQSVLCFLLRAGNLGFQSWESGISLFRAEIRDFSLGFHCSDL